ETSTVGTGAVELFRDAPSSALRRRVVSDLRQSAAVNQWGSAAGSADSRFPWNQIESPDRRLTMISPLMNIRTPIATIPRSHATEFEAPPSMPIPFPDVRQSSLVAISTWFPAMTIAQSNLSDPLTRPLLAP